VKYKNKIIKAAAYIMYVAALFVASAIVGVVVKILIYSFLFGYNIL